MPPGGRPSTPDAGVMFPYRRRARRQALAAAERSSSLPRAALDASRKLLGGGGATAAGRLRWLSKILVLVSPGISTETPTRPRVVAASSKCRFWLRPRTADFAVV